MIIFKHCQMFPGEEGTVTPGGEALAYITQNEVSL